MKRLLLLLFSVPLLAVACGPAAGGAEDESEIITVAEDDPEMDAAIAEAQRTLPEFLAVLNDRPAGADEFVIKFPLGGYEHIWVDDPRLSGDVLVGRLSNVPVQEGYAMGDEVRVPLAEVSDWAWRDASGVMHGHRTTRVLLPRIAPEEAASLRAYMGWD